MVVLTAVAAMALLAPIGCTTDNQPSVTGTATPQTCPVDAPADAACRQVTHVRWVVDVPVLVVESSTWEHGHLVFLDAIDCPGATPTSPYAPTWAACESAPMSTLKYDGATLWLVVGDHVFGVTAATGEVTHDSVDAALASSVVTMNAQYGTPSPAPDLALPRGRPAGLEDAAASGPVIGVGDAVILPNLGCVAGSVVDIPDAPKSHGRPAITGVCTHPVLYAVNL